MQSRCSRRRSGRRGFTMIEMLTVIAIIAILAGILFPVFATVRRNVHKTTCMSNLHQIGVALKIFKDEHNGAYPDALMASRSRHRTGTPLSFRPRPRCIHSI